MTEKRIKEVASADLRHATPHLDEDSYCLCTCPSCEDPAGRCVCNECDHAGNGPFHDDSEEHVPWSYTEYGVLCTCGAPMDRNERCTAFRTAYGMCSHCQGSGHEDGLEGIRTCGECAGNCYVRLRDARGRFTTVPA